MDAIVGEHHGEKLRDRPQVCEPPGIPGATRLPQPPFLTRLVLYALRQCATGLQAGKFVTRLQGILWAAVGTGALLMASCAKETGEPARLTAVTVFATAGVPVEVELGRSVPAGSTLHLSGLPAFATLDGTRLTIAHETPVHERISIEVDEPGDTTRELTLWYAAQPEGAPAWPLSVSADGRHIADHNGDPVFWTGTAAWGIAVVPPREDAALYLADRSRKGVNAILIRMVDHMFSDRDPPWVNHAGNPPFERTLPNGALDFTRPAAAYWENVDWVIREAYRHGMVVLCAPAYLGYELGDEGWANQIAANGTERMRRYGEWLGARYRDYPNIVWVMGGDCSPKFGGRSVVSEVDALAFGIKSVDSVHLMTAHSRRERSARDDYERPWLDLNATYTSKASVHDRTETDYRRSPPMPTFLIEAFYGNEHGVTDRDIRAQMYQAMLSGAFGQMYGNAPQWYFSASTTDVFADMRRVDWKDNLDGHGAQYLPVIAQLIREYPFDRLEPDFDHRVMTSGYGGGSSDYAPLVCGPDLAIAYIPDGRRVTFDMSRFSGSVRCLWRNPANGTTRRGKTFPNSGRAVIAPPARGDWILILDARSVSG